MKKTLHYGILLIAGATLLASCGSSVKVAGISFSKRVYRGGYTVIMPRHEAGNQAASVNATDTATIAGNATAAALPASVEQPADLLACNTECNNVATSLTIEKKLEKRGMNIVESVRNLYGAGYKDTREFVREYKSLKKEYASTFKAASKNASVAKSGGGAGMSITSFVCGIVGLLVCGIILGILAIIFGAIGLNRGMKGLAIAGLILGVLDIIGALLVLL